MKTKNVDKLVGKLGRIPSVRDFRDHLFLATAPLPKPGVVRRRWFVPPAWDQGQTSQCVAFSSLLYLNAGPVRNTKVSAVDAPRFYDDVRLLDGFPMPHEGSTVRAAMQLLNKGGYVPEYLWAFDVQAAANWVLAKGPCVAGTDWLYSMFETEPFHGTSFIKFDPTSGVAGGHAWLIFGVDKVKRCPDGSTGAFVMQNSWSSSWGSNGRSWISFEAMKALLSEDGELAMASEVIVR